MRRALLIALSIGSLAVACARVQMPHATPADAARGGARFPGVTVSELEQGRSLYVSKCSACHQPVEPTRLRPEEWPGHVEEMRGRAHLDAEQARLVEQYLVTMSSQQDGVAAR
jgi:cytochrome c5